MTMEADTAAAPRVDSDDSDPNDDDGDPFASSARSRLRHQRRTSDIFRRCCAPSSAVDGSGPGVAFFPPPPPPPPEDGSRPARSPSSLAGASSGSLLVARPLLPGEVDALTSWPCRCRCPDWSLVRLCYYRYVVVDGDDHDHGRGDGDLSDLLMEQVSDTRFEGVVLLGVVLPSSPKDPVPGRPRRRRTGPGPGCGGGPSLPPAGVHDNALVRDCVLEPGCRVHRNTVLERTHVHTGASVLNCGTVSRTILNPTNNRDAAGEDADGGSRGDGERYPDFASGLVVKVGPESGGGRSIPCHPESTVVDAAVSLGVSVSSALDPRSAPHDRNDDDERDGGGDSSSPLASASTLPATSCPLNVLCPNSLLINSSSVCDVYLSPNTKIDSSPQISNVTLLPNSSITSGAIVSDSILQWNVQCSDSANVSDSIMMEASGVGAHCRISSSVVGPDCHLEGGEVQCSVLGPHVNAHHQSLVIGVVWLAGRGNVGYGANVGSNHTGRTADQECWAGEGVFWGLSTCIKFPVDLTRSPYSIIAAGVTLPPQRVCMPFSLVAEHDEGGKNQILPGWVLRHSAYTVARAEGKYASRNGAIRHGRRYAMWEVMRPGIVDLCLEAREALLSTSNDDGHGKVGAVAGIGKCVLTERGRADGVRAYTDAVRRYALRGLLDRLLSGRRRGEGAIAGGREPSSGGFRGCSTLEDSVRGDALRTPASEQGRNRGAVPPPSTDRGTGSAVMEAGPSSPILPWEEAPRRDAGALWMHQRAVLESEFGAAPPEIAPSRAPPPPEVVVSSPSSSSPLESVASMASMLRELVELEKRHADRVFRSKQKDDVRGERVIPRYSECRVPAGDDAVVRSAREEAARVESAVNDLLVAMDRGGGEGGNYRSWHTSRL